MKKEKGSRVVSIVAIMIGVLSITIAFTAYSSTLKIKSKANLQPNGYAFNVEFSSKVEDVEEGIVVPILESTAEYDADFVATDAIIVNGRSSKITNLSATFTAPGQEVSYVFYAHNVGKYDAYLKSIAFTNVNNGNSTKVCRALDDSSSSAYSVCNAISLSIDVGTLTDIKESKAGINSHILDKGAAEKIVVTIRYNEGYEEANGDFEVLFGDIELGYSSVN